MRILQFIGRVCGIIGFQLILFYKHFVSQNLHVNRDNFTVKGNAFVFDHQHRLRDISCKPLNRSILGAKWPEL